MATRVETRRERASERGDLGTLIDGYLRDAEAGRALDPAGIPYTAAGLRSLRRALVPVDAHATIMDVAAAHAAGGAALEQLGRSILDHAGLPPSRLDSILPALRGLAEHAAGDEPAAPPAAQQPGRATEQPPWDVEPRAPTYTMLALGAQVGTWMERIIVIAFVLTAIGLALALV